MSQLIKFVVLSVLKLLSTSNGNRIKTSTIGISSDEWHAFLSFEQTVALSQFTLFEVTGQFTWRKPYAGLWHRERVLNPFLGLRVGSC